MLSKAKSLLILLTIFCSRVLQQMQCDTGACCGHERAVLIRELACMPVLTSVPLALPLDVEQ